MEYTKIQTFSFKISSLVQKCSGIWERGRGGEVFVGRGERKLFCKDCFIYKIRFVMNKLIS